LKKAICFIFCALFLCLPVASGEGALSAVQLRGSGTVMGLMQQVAEAYMSERSDAAISITGGGTDRAIEALIDGTCQVAMASAEPNAELMMRAEQKGVHLSSQVIAFDAIVLFISPENPVSGLTIDQLRGIYSGEIVNWKEVGGADLPVELVSRGKSSGTYEGFKHLVLGEDAILPTAALEMDSIPERQYVAAHPGAIGFASFSYVDSSVKPLTIEGVAPSEDSIRARSYPLTRNLLLYSRGDADQATQDFLQFTLDNIAHFTGSGIYPAS
jgi:phosphate transport system substrate-binding protein